MFIGFIPFVFLLAAAVLSLRGETHHRAQATWLVAAVLVVIWAVYHGSHHWSVLRTLSAW